MYGSFFPLPNVQFLSVFFVLWIKHINPFFHINFFKYLFGVYIFPKFCIYTIIFVIIQNQWGSQKVPFSMHSFWQLRFFPSFFFTFFPISFVLCHLCQCIFFCLKPGNIHVKCKRGFKQTGGLDSAGELFNEVPEACRLP